MVGHVWLPVPNITLDHVVCFARSMSFVSFVLCKKVTRCVRHVDLWKKRRVDSDRPANKLSEAQVNKLRMRQARDRRADE